MRGMTDIIKVSSTKWASGICELKRRHKKEATSTNLHDIMHKATAMRWGAWESMRDGKCVHGVTNVHGVTIMNKEQSRK